MAVALDALASYVQNMLTQMVSEEVHMLLGISGEIDNMGTKLCDLKNFLADADRRNITDRTVKAWVTELRNAMYEATDILDLCHLKAMNQDPSKDMGCFNPLLFCMQNPLHAHDIGTRIKSLNQKLDDIQKRSKNYDFINLSTYQDRGKWATSSFRVRNRETSGVFDESGLIGEKIEEDTRSLVDMLIKKQNRSAYNYSKIMVFAIVGVGGIGKTTLAQNIYNNDIINKEFTKRIWLSVNNDFSEVKLLKRTIAQAGGSHHIAEDAKATLQQILKEVVYGKKILLVMDDVWDHNVWEDVLKPPLFNSLAQGSRVLVTTRHYRVAHGMMAEKPYHYVDKLQPEDAWSLLKMKVVGNENDEHQVNLLQDIGMEIIVKCDGLPLAVKVMGGLLRQRSITRWEWECVRDARSRSQLPEELNYEVYLSYQDLQPCLKPCFLHFSLLPNSTEFHVNDVVGMWISEGFVHGDSAELEDLGREYYDQLISRSLIQPEAHRAIPERCTMHDIIRSFGHYMVRDEALVAHCGETDITSKLNSTKFIRLALESKGSESNELEWSSLQAQTSLRTLISVGNIKIKTGDSLSYLSSLRSLHLEDAKFDPLVESLPQLKHLRYLSVNGSDISRLPKDIGKMKFLHHISCVDCERLTTLPSSITELQQLRVLEMGFCITTIPKGFGGLTNLRKLTVFPSHMDGDWCSLEELRPLTRLTVLFIYGLENISSSLYAKRVELGKKMHLRHLSLWCNNGDDCAQVVDVEGMTETKQQLIEEVFDELCPPACLESITMFGYSGRRLPRWTTSVAGSHLRSLRMVTIELLPFCTELPNGLCHLPFLEILEILYAEEIKRVGHEFLGLGHRRHNNISQVEHVFPRLWKLTFSEMMKWEKWEWEEPVKAMPLLKELILEGCKLRHIPRGLSFHASELRTLLINNVQHLSAVENFTSVVHLSVCNGPNIARISNLPRLQKLDIVDCPKLKVLEGVNALQRLNLKDHAMDMVATYLQHVNPRQLVLDCSPLLFLSLAVGKSSSEWCKLSHIQEVRAYASLIQAYMKYTRDPFSFETNIMRSAIAQVNSDLRRHNYWQRCPIQDEWPVGQGQEPLCLRLRWKAIVYLAPWLGRACLHCNEAAGLASPSGRWTEALVDLPGATYPSRYHWRLQEQKLASPS